MMGEIIPSNPILLNGLFGAFGSLLGIYTNDIILSESGLDQTRLKIMTVKK